MTDKMVNGNGSGKKKIIALSLAAGVLAVIGIFFYSQSRIEPAEGVLHISKDDVLQLLESGIELEENLEVYDVRHSPDYESLWVHTSYDADPVIAIDKNLEMKPVPHPGFRDMMTWGRSDFAFLNIPQLRETFADREYIDDEPEGKPEWDPADSYFAFNYSGYGKELPIYRVVGEQNILTTKLPMSGEGFQFAMWPAAFYLKDGGDIIYFASIGRPSDVDGVHLKIGKYVWGDAGYELTAEWKCPDTEAQLVDFDVRDERIMTRSSSIISPRIQLWDFTDSQAEPQNLPSDDFNVFLSQELIETIEARVNELDASYR